MGRRPDLLSCFFKSRANVPVRERPSGFAAGKAAKRRDCCGSNKDIRRRRQKSRAACFFGRGRRPDAPYFILLLKKQVKCSRKGTVLRSFCFCKKNQKARAACCPDRGMLSMQWKVPERETGCYFLRRAKSNTKSTCSDVQKVASGKFLCVGDRRNRENCERM